MATMLSQYNDVDYTMVLKPSFDNVFNFPSLCHNPFTFQSLSQEFRRHTGHKGSQKRGGINGISCENKFANQSGSEYYLIDGIGYGATLKHSLQESFKNHANS
jgi:hypothetical protein